MNRQQNGGRRQNGGDQFSYGKFLAKTLIQMAISLALGLAIKTFDLSSLAEFGNAAVLQYTVVFTLIQLALTYFINDFGHVPDVFKPSGIVQILLFSLGFAAMFSIEFLPLPPQELWHYPLIGFYFVVFCYGKSEKVTFAIFDKFLLETALGRFIMYTSAAALLLGVVALARILVELWR